MPKPPARVADGHCNGCGHYFIRPKARPSKDSVTYCGRECHSATITRVRLEREALRSIGARARRHAARNTLVDVEVEALRRIGRWRPGRRPTVRNCTRCGVKCIGSGEMRRTCVRCKDQARKASKQLETSKAARRKAKLARRAVERGLKADRIDPLDVIRQDGERCYLCGVSTPLDLRGTYQPNAPEIDHVVPLALGGTHTRDNVRCCCRGCNGAKGASLPRAGRLGT